MITVDDVFSEAIPGKFGTDFLERLLFNTMEICSDIRFQPGDEICDARDSEPRLRIVISCSVLTVKSRPAKEGKYSRTTYDNPLSEWHCCSFEWKTKRIGYLNSEIKRMQQTTERFKQEIESLQ